MKNLNLHDGQRYFICISANETILNHEQSTVVLPSVSACSDGVVVDDKAPTGGKVWVGRGLTHQRYQVSSIGNKYLAMLSTTSLIIYLVVMMIHSFTKPTCFTG